LHSGFGHLDDGMGWGAGRETVLRQVPAILQLKYNKTRVANTIRMVADKVDITSVIDDKPIATLVVCATKNEETDNGVRNGTGGKAGHVSGVGKPDRL